MINFGYNNRWIRLVKDILFMAVGGWLIYRGGVFAIVLGALALYWYGRDAWFQAKVLWQDKHYKAPEPAKPTEEKITVTSDAKEVDFEKE